MKAASTQKFSNTKIKTNINLKKEKYIKYLSHTHLQSERRGPPLTQQG